MDTYLVFRYNTLEQYDAGMQHPSLITLEHDGDLVEIDSNEAADLLDVWGHDEGRCEEHVKTDSGRYCEILRFSSAVGNRLWTALRHRCGHMTFPPASATMTTTMVRAAA